MRRFHRGRLISGIAACAALAALLVYFEYLPTKQEVHTAQAELSRIEAELAVEQAFLLRANKTGINDSTLQAERRATFLELASADSLELFVDQIESDMAEFGFTHAHVAPVIEELLAASTISLENVRLAPLRFAVESQAGFLDIGRFLERLEQQRYFSGVSTLSISHNEGTNPDVLCQLQFLAYLRGAE